MQVIVFDRPMFHIVFQLLEKYPVNVYCNAPTAYRMMVQENLQSYNFKALRHCLSAGEALVCLLVCGVTVNITSYTISVC